MLQATSQHAGLPLTLLLHYRTRPRARSRLPRGSGNTIPRDSGNTVAAPLHSSLRRPSILRRQPALLAVASAAGKDGPTWQRPVLFGSRAAPSYTEFVQSSGRACFSGSTAQRASSARVRKERAKSRLGPSLDRAGSRPALAGTTAAIVVLLLPAALCPYTIADLGMRKLGTVAAVSSRDDDDDRLADLLRSASMGDKTVIMTFANEALALPGSLLQIFLESFRTGVRTQPLLKHLVVVATDAKGFDRCRHMHPLCYPMLDPGGGAGDGMKAVEVDLAWARNRFQARVLALGYGFVFTDVGTVWFRNPLLRVPVGADIAVACDRFHGDNPYDLNKPASGGLVYARPTAAAAAFLDGWYEARTRYPGERDGLVFDRVKHELAARHGAAVQLMDTAYFAGNCEFGNSDFHQVCTFQANCLDGLQGKIERLNAVLDEWKQFKAQQLLLGTNITALTY